VGIAPQRKCDGRLVKIETLRRFDIPAGSMPRSIDVILRGKILLLKARIQSNFHWKTSCSA
jgi:hypothetical protein